jgi:predicted DCC family thiol-disulfide oxidoreductase YuxK
MKTIMLYDGLCILCQQTQKTVRLFDWLGRVERLNAQDHAAVLARFPELATEDILGEIYVQANDGRWLVGFFGMRHLAWQIPLGWFLLPIFYLPGMNTLGPKMYGWVAKRRYQINKFMGNDCPDGACKINYA